MTKSLVAFDTNHVKGYVFGTSKLKEIRGASALLDRLNREEMARLVREIDTEARAIYANGGAGLFVVESSSVSEVIEAVTNSYYTTTRGTGSITGASVEMVGPLADEHRALDLVRYRLRANKDASLDSLPVFTHPLLHFCDSCGEGYAVSTANDSMRICASCARKRAEDETVKEDIGLWATHVKPYKESRLWGRLLEDLEIHLGYPVQHHRRPESFEDLGDASTPSNYLGLIYADGDSMGQTVDGIQTLDRMEQFSDAADNAIYEATAEAIHCYLQPRYNSDVLPFDILLLGGDDLVMVTRAESALEVAQHVVKRFPELTKATWGQALRLSASVVISHINYPFKSLLDLAASGLRFAKRRAVERRQKGEELATGLVNFLAVSSANHLDFDLYYNQVLRTQLPDRTRLIRTQRPYSAAELADLLQTIRDLKEQGVPSTKLEQLRQACYKSRHQGAIDAMMAVLRLRNKHHQLALLSLMDPTSLEQAPPPWVKMGDKIWTTPIVDIVELYDFVARKVTI